MNANVFPARLKLCGHRIWPFSFFPFVNIADGWQNIVSNQEQWRVIAPMIIADRAAASRSTMSDTEAAKERDLNGLRLDGHDRR